MTRNTGRCQRDFHKWVGASTSSTLLSSHVNWICLTQMFEVMLQSCVQYSELQWHQSPKHNIFQVLFNFTAIEITQFRCDNSSGQLMSRNAYSFSGARQEVLP